MTLLALVSCDRLRHGQPCRAYLPLPLDHLGDETSVDPLYTARESAVSAGWNLGDRDTCPSPGHDEESV